MAPLREDNEADIPRPRGLNWANIIAYALISALILLALAPLLSAV